MGVKLNKETSDVIHVSQMKDGQIAEIINWNIDVYKMSIVVKSGHILVDLGSGESFDFKKTTNVIQYPDNKVRILKNGETLTITDNE